MGRTGFGWLRIGPVAGFRKHGNEPSGSIKKAGYCLTSQVTNATSIYSLTSRSGSYSAIFL